jgi:hypothetical protein
MICNDVVCLRHISFYTKERQVSTKRSRICLPRFNCQSKCNSYYAFTLARTTDPVLLQLLWHGPERPFHQHSYIRSAGFRTGRVSTSHCNRQLPLSVIFVYHGIVVTKKKDRIQTYHSRSCLSPHIEKISMLYRNHDTGLFGQFQAFSGLL